MLFKRIKSFTKTEKIMIKEVEDKQERYYRKLANKMRIFYWLLVFLVFGAVCYFSSCATPKKHLIRPIPRPSSNLRNY